MTSLEIAKKTINDHLTGVDSNDNRLRAAVGFLNSESANLLILATASLKERIAGAAKELGDTLEKQVDKTIESNKNLATSNNISAWAMIFLTIALVGVGIWQGYLTWKNLNFQQEQWRQENQRNEIRDNCIRNGGTKCP